MFILCCDGLIRLPQTTRQLATAQTCVVHLIRAVMRFVQYQDRGRIAATLKPIYTAVNADTTLDEPETLEGGASWARSTPPS